MRIAYAPEMHNYIDDIAITIYYDIWYVYTSLLPDLFI